MTQLPDGPWEELSIDFAEVSGCYVLILVDDYSRYPVVEILNIVSEWLFLN